MLVCVGLSLVESLWLLFHGVLTFELALLKLPKIDVAARVIVGSDVPMVKCGGGLQVPARWPRRSARFRRWMKTLWLVVWDVKR